MSFYQCSGEEGALVLMIGAEDETKAEAEAKAGVVIR